MPQAKKKPTAETQPQQPQQPQEPQTDPQQPQQPQDPQTDPQQPQDPQQPSQEPQQPQEQPQEPQRESQTVGSAVIVPHPTTVRGPIELDYNKQRDDREQQYREDRLALEDDYHSDLGDLKDAKSGALVTAGLNPDGSTPPDYPG